MLHAALLLLMLEAVNHGPRFTISLKRSTQNLQLSTSCRLITPSECQKADIDSRALANWLLRGDHKTGSRINDQGSLPVSVLSI
jgi:hypothetical protein